MAEVLFPLVASIHINCSFFSRYNLGTFYFGTNHFAMAKYQFNESYHIHKTFLGEDHADTKVVKAALDEVSKMV